VIERHERALQSGLELVITIEARPAGPTADQYASALARSCQYRRYHI